MDDPALVRVRQRAGDVAQHAHRLRNAHRARRSQARAQALALDERHRVEWHAGRFAGAEHGDDVRLLQRRGEPDLALEPLGADALRELGREELDDDFATEARLVGQEDARHAAAAELLLEGIGGAERRLQLRAQIHQRRRGAKGPKTVPGGNSTALEATLWRQKRPAPGVPGEPNIDSRLSPTPPIPSIADQ
jgi:hypothetical protein